MSERLASNGLTVEVAYAGPEGQLLIGLTLPEGATVADAVTASRIVSRLNLFEATLGYAIFGQRARGETPLRSGDRVELLRPLVADPKEARRARALMQPLPPSRAHKRTRRS